MAACHLIRHLDEAAQKGEIVGEVILLPSANPIGMAQTLHTHHIGRFAFADGGANFNRGWPDLSAAVVQEVKDKIGEDADQNIAMVRAALVRAVKNLPETSEREVHQKTLLSLSIDADFVFDLHCDAQALLHLFAHEEHQNLISELAQDTGARAVILEKSIDSGLFDECNGGTWIKIRRILNLSPTSLPAACFSPTVELRGQGDVTQKFGIQDAANIMNFLRRQGMIAGPAPKLPKQLCELSSVDFCDMVRAPCAGMVIWHQPIGAQINRGDLVAEILDPTAADPWLCSTEVRAPHSGLLFSHRIGYMTRPGEILGQIAGTEPTGQQSAGQFLNP